MTHDDRGIGRRFRLARVLPSLVLFASLLAVLPASAQDAPTQSQCSDKWYVASAHLSCSTELSISVSDNQCRIQVKCKNQWWVVYRPNQNLVSNDITASLTDTANLSNCNGTLKVGSC